MTISFERRGSGTPLLLVHGLGSSRAAWKPVIPMLEKQRQLILLDLPGHGASPAEPDSGTFAGLARSFGLWLSSEGLQGVQMAGSSLGARLVLEMARRGATGPVTAFDPGGFWQGWERTMFKTTLTASTRLLRLLGSAVPTLARNAVSRSALLAQLSARPWKLDGDFVAGELVGLAKTPTVDSLIDDLAGEPMQQGPAASGPVTIAWGRHDRLCLPAQAERARSAFPGARLEWFAHSGHFPMWDEPEKAARLMLEMD